VNISDAVRQPEDIRAIYGDLPVKVLRACDHKRSERNSSHSSHCYDDASVDATDLAGGGRMVVID
jgi:hypothetical protein